jgi:hypothetical protein
MKQAKRLTLKQKRVLRKAAEREALLVAGVITDPRDLKNLPPGHYNLGGDAAASIITTSYKVVICSKTP